MKRNTRTWIMILCAAIIVLAACGQKSGVSLTASGGGSGDSGSLDGGDEGFGDGGGDGTSTDGTGSSTGGTSSGGTTGGGTSGGTTGGTTRTGTRTGTGTGTGTGGTAAPDRTGINDAEKTITIGIHAPVTGAAPIEQKTFEYGKDVYWDWLNDNGKLFDGYRVIVKFRDDQFDPVTARRKCAEMVEQDKVFLLIGGAGADQITACANYANSKGIPYLSAGVNTEGLDGLRTYFALSQTYAQQSKPLAQLIKNQIGKTKVGLAVLDTKSFADARVSAIKEFQAAGLQIVADKKVPKTAGPNEAKAVAGDLQSAGAEVVYALVSPTIFLYMAQGAASNAYFPQYVGPGVTNGLNTVAKLGCPGIGAAKFFSPFPQLDVIDSMDPAYKPAYKKYATEQEADDIGIALWGLNKGLHQMFKAFPDAKSLSRQSFIATVAGGQTFETGVYPKVTYGPTSRFGADSVHLLTADCQTQQYRTTTRFAKGF